MFTKNKMERKEMVPIISTSFESLILYITDSMLELERLIYQKSDSSMIIFKSSVEENVSSNLLSLSLSLVVRKKNAKTYLPENYFNIDHELPIWEGVTILMTSPGNTSSGSWICGLRSTINGSPHLSLMVWRVSPSPTT